MKALSLYQPWASLMAGGKKRIETRSWPHPGPFPAIVAIHAAKTWTGRLAALCRESPFREALEECSIFTHSDARNLRRAKGNMPFGCVLAIGRIREVIGTEEVIFKASELTEYKFGDYSPGRYAWVFDKIIPLPEPIAVDGQRGLWDWVVPQLAPARVFWELTKIEEATDGKQTVQG